MSALFKITKYLLTLSAILIFFIIFFNFILRSKTVPRFIFDRAYPISNSARFGVSFSPRFARYLKLDWQKVYLQILDELKVKNLRLPSYWNSLESEQGKYDFSDTDFMLDEANKRGVKIILVLGIRQPRWPECHMPEWTKTLTVPERQQAILKFVENVVKRYQANSSIWAYQVENEPFVSWFGENCDPPNAEFLKQEIELVKKIDPKKPIIITDSGEWGIWIDSLNLADIFGISIYKKAFNPNFDSYFTYPFTPWMYNLKSDLIKNLTGKKDKKVIVTELQAEPWLSMRDSEESIPQKQAQLFSSADFKDNIEFAKKTNFDEAYLWGVEWWYFMAGNGHPEYLDYAKTLF